MKILKKTSVGVVTSAVLLSVTSSAGIQGSGFRSLLAVGTVTDPVHAGSDTLVVGGLPYSTSHAIIQIDGHAGTQGQIHKGDVVSLLATASSDGSTASASQVAINGSIQGTVSSIDAPSATLFVLGQTVHVNSQTVFGSATKATGLSALQSGTTVEVGGFADSAGDLVATRIETKGQSSVSRVVGSIRSLDTAQHSFYVNALKINYGSAEVDAVLTDSAPVSVQGVKFAVDGALVANQVHSAGPTQGLPGSIGRIQGLITNFPSSAYFEVNGQRVLINTQTRLALAVPLALDVAVEVAGTFDTGGVLVAESVQTSR
ncbi:MAG TPA: DUF5666 domain-containing protein [Steroidobacteraceae bacterium]